MTEPLEGAPAPSVHSPREALALLALSATLLALLGLAPKGPAGSLWAVVLPTLQVLAWTAPAYAVAARRRVDPLVAHGLLVRPRGALRALALALPLLPLYTLGFALLMRTRGTTPQEVVWSAALGEAGRVLVSHLAFVALPEEYLFRGVVQPSLSRERPARGVAITSVLFALAHVLVDRDPLRAIVFFPSLVFGWLRVRTGSIVPGIAFHAACNAVDAGVRVVFR